MGIPTSDFKLLLVVCAIVITTTIHAQQPTFSWVRAIGGSSDQEILGVATDSLDNVYTVGTYFGTTVFDPSGSAISFTSLGSTDAFVMKQNAAGSVQWIRRMAGIGTDALYSVAVNNRNEVVVAGSFTSATQVDPDHSAFNLLSEGGSDAIVCVFNSEGRLKWARQCGGQGADISYGVTVDGNDNVYVCGQFYCVMDIDSSASKIQLKGSNFLNGFIISFDSVGTYRWNMPIVATDNCNALSITCDQAGRVYCIGNFESTVFLGLSQGGITSAGKRDAYIVSLDFDGRYLWGSAIQGSDDNTLLSVSHDRNSHLVLCGSFRGSINADIQGSAAIVQSKGGTDALLIRMRDDGTMSWARSFGSWLLDDCHACCTDSHGNIVVCGSFCDSVAFDSAHPDSVLVAPGTSPNVFLTSFDSSGSNLWSYDYGTASTDIGTCVTCDRHDNILQGGYIGKGANFHPGFSDGRIVGSGFEDAYCVKLDAEYVTGLATNFSSGSDPDISVFPNPSSGNVSVECRHDNENVVVHLNTILGRQLDQFSLNAGQSRIELSLLPGLYALQFIAADHVRTQLLVVDR